MKQILNLHVKNCWVQTNSFSVEIQSIISGFKTRLSTPVSSTYLGIFRIAFGVIMVLQFASHFSRVADYNVPDALRFSYPGFDFIPALSGSGLQILLILGILCSILSAAGTLFKWSTAGIFILFSYLQLQDALHYNNHYYFFSLIACLLIFTEADKSFLLSLNPRKGKSNQKQVQYWQFFILQLMVFIVYFYGGLAKLNSDWLDGNITKFMTGIGGEYPLLIAWSGMLFDLLIGFLLFWKRSRLVAIVLSLAFNLINGLVFFGDIHLFPFAMIAATFLFVDPDNWDSWLKRTNKSSKKKKSSKEKKSASISNPSILIRYVLTGFFIFQFLFPFRHHLISGNVDWTGQGHYMAWRMKSYHKDAKISITSNDPNTGNVIQEFGNLGLSPEAEQRIGAFPHLVLQLVKEVASQLEGGSASSPEVRVDYKVAFNGRSTQNCIDPNLDLSNKKFKIWTSNKWILPLRD